MKSATKYIIIIIGMLLFNSCQDVVEVDLETEQPKLVIDANIKWQKGSNGSEQKIILSTTTNFYNNIIPSASGANVTISNNDDFVFNFVEKPNTGEYICTNFIPVINDTYTLKVIYKGQTYTSTEKLYATPEIDGIEQKIVPGFTGENFYQVKFFYQDNGAENNFYLIGFKSEKEKFPDYGALTDEFFQGNQMFGFYGSDDVEPGNKLDISLQAISEQHFNFMNKLLSISGGGGGGPFATPPATLRGNIKNESDEKNFPFGYFNLSEIDTDVYTIE